MFVRGQTNSNFFYGISVFVSNSVNTELFLQILGEKNMIMRFDNVYSTINTTDSVSSVLFNHRILHNLSDQIKTL